MQDGLRRMYGSTDEHPHGEDVFYYLTVYNEPSDAAAEPENLDVDGILRGHLPRSARPTTGDGDERPRMQLLASGVAVPWALKAQQMLAEEWQVARRRVVGDLVERAAPRRACAADE